MIKFSKVSKRFEQGFEALHNISFEIGKDELVFLTGHSGAGKSTMLKLIALLDRSSQGQITIGDTNLARISRRQIPRLRQSIGMISQNPMLLNERSVFDNVALPLVIAGYRHQEIGRRVRAALDKVSLLSKEKMLPPALSTGEQQRLGIARAVVNRPPLLLADEPTGNLDPGLSAEIMTLFEEFNRVGTCVFIATHDLALIATKPHRILTLKDGHLINGENNG